MPQCYPKATTGQPNGMSSKAKSSEIRFSCLRHINTTDLNAYAYTRNEKRQVKEILRLEAADWILEIIFSHSAINDATWRNTFRTVLVPSPCDFTLPRSV